MKDTSLVSAIGLSDILRQSGIAARVTKEAFLFFGTACMIYLVLAIISSSASTPSSAGPTRRRCGGERDEPERRNRRTPASAGARLAARASARHGAHRPLGAPGIGLVAYLISAWNPELFQKYAPAYVSGLGVTLSLVGLSIVFGRDPVDPIAYARMSANPILRAVSYGYVYFFRGTPLLAQTFLIYYGFGSFRPQLEAVGLWSFFRDAWSCAVFALLAQHGCYQAETCAAPLRACPRPVGMARDRWG